MLPVTTTIAALLRCLIQKMKNMIRPLLLGMISGTLWTNGSSLGAIVSVTDSNVLNGLTPYNWVAKNDFISSAVGGASLKLGFNDTKQVALQLDNSHLVSLPASRYPIICWSVNGGSIQTRQLAKAETAVLLAASSTNPVIDLYIKGMSPFEDRYTGDLPLNSVKITGFVIDPGGSTVAVPHPGKVWLNIGDSILSGDAAGYAAGQGRPPMDHWAASDDARASYGYLLARRYGYQEARLAFGGYNWAGGLAHVPALATLIDQKTSTINRLQGGLLNPVPDVVLINLGENGKPALPSVTRALRKLRSRVALKTKIIVIVPVAGTARTQVAKAFNSYAKASKDTNAFLVDLGSISYATADGQHPTAAGHQTIFRAALPALNAIIGETNQMWLPQ